MVATRVTKEKPSGYLTPCENCKLCTCDHFVIRAVLWQFRAFTLTSFVYLSLDVFHNDGIEINTLISVIVASPRSWVSHHNLGCWWCHSDLNLGINFFIHTGINTLRLRQNGRHFPDDIFKCFFLNENVWISITISLKFVPKGLINNIPALVQIMAWRRPGDKPLSQSYVLRICATHYESYEKFARWGCVHVWGNKSCQYYVIVALNMEILKIGTLTTVNIRS